MNSPMVAALQAAEKADPSKAQSIIPDRTHPGPAIAAVMAGAILKAWNAPSTVAAASIDGVTGTLISASNTTISNIVATTSTISFQELDGSIPWPLDRNPLQMAGVGADTPPLIAGDADTFFLLPLVDLDETLNLDRLAVQKLTAAQYSVSVDGTDVGHFSSTQLAAGINMATLSKAAPNVQSQSAIVLTDQHTFMHLYTLQAIISPNDLEGNGLAPSFQGVVNARNSQENSTIRQVVELSKPKIHSIRITALHQ